jgi:hypothetical protein
MKYSVSVLLILVAAIARAQPETRQTVSILDYVTKYGIFRVNPPLIG